MQLKTFGSWASFTTSVGAGALTQSPDYSWLALPVAIISGTVFVILAIMFLFSHRREIYAGARWVEPSHAIILGLLIAVGGLIWQWRHVAPADPQIAQLQSQVDDLQKKLSQQQQAAAATIAPPSAQPPIKPSKNYFPKEKKDLGDLYSSILDRLNKDGMLAAKQAYNFGADTPAGNKHQLSSHLTRITDTRKLASDLRKYIYNDLLPNNPSYNFELSQLFSNSADNVPLGPFQRELEKYHRAISIFVDRYDGLAEEDRAITADLIKQTTPHLLETSQLFQNWIQQCNERIDAQREVLR